MRSTGSGLACAAALAASLGLAACSPDDAPQSEQPPAERELATGATLQADPRTAQPVPLAGQRIEVVVAGYDSPDAQLTVANVLVEQAAGAQVDVRTASTPAEANRLLDTAVDSGPLAVVVIGPALIGSADLLSAQALDQRFVVLGGQMAEPTDNVQAVVWPGADGRAALAGETRTFDNVGEYADAAVRVALSTDVLGSDVGLVHRVG